MIIVSSVFMYLGNLLLFHQLHPTSSLPLSRKLISALAGERLNQFIFIEAISNGIRLEVLVEASQRLMWYHCPHPRMGTNLIEIQSIHRVQH